MLDQCKSAVINDRESRKNADAILRKSGQVSMLATSMAQDYDELPGDLGDGARVAHLSVTVEEMRVQLKGVEDAAAAEVAATASRAKKEKEDIALPLQLFKFTERPHPRLQCLVWIPLRLSLSIGSATDCLGLR